MKHVYHIAEDVSRASGGVRTVVFDLQKWGAESSILTTCCDTIEEKVKVFDNKGPWLYSRDLSDHLKNLSEDSIFHAHGVWMHAQYTTARTAHKKGIPFIVSPHGMYQPWLWNNGTFKKKLYFKLFSKSAFAKADYVHAITPDEEIHLRQLFPDTKTVCIPNAIKITEPPARSIQGRPYLLFLGRLHYIKGLELLMEVFSQLQDLDFDLYIAGTQNEYSDRLKSKYPDARIKFLGAVRGNEKSQLYRNAHVFIAPSYSEVVGMVNLEAAAMETPVITTHQTGLLPGWNERGGLLINPEQKELIKAIRSATSWTEETRRDRGRELRKFVQEEYSWEVIGEKWKQLYDSL